MIEAERQSAIKAEIQGLAERIRQVKEHEAENIGYHVARGEYEAVRQVHSRMNEETRRLYREIIDLGRLLPPLTTEEKGVLRLHPVTPENRHFLYRPIFSDLVGS